MKNKLKRERQERIKNAQESAKSFQENFRTSQTDTPGSAPSGTPNFNKFLEDPEIVQSLMVNCCCLFFKYFSTFFFYFGPFTFAGAGSTRVL